MSAPASPRYVSLTRSFTPERKRGIGINVELVFFSFSSNTASRIRYEITSGNIGGAFAVKNMTGAIYVAGALDYETRKRVSTSKIQFVLSIMRQVWLVAVYFSTLTKEN